MAGVALRFSARDSARIFSERFPMRVIRSIVLVLGLGAYCVARAQVITATPADVASKIASLTPGAVLELRADAGNYTGGLAIYNLNGTPTQPITIRGPLTGPRPVIEGTMGTNVVRIRSSSYVVLQNMEINGMGREGFGIAADGGNCPHDIVIENFHIHDLEQNQQVVGIAANGCSGVSWNWTIRGNRIERVGTGMYLGSSSGGIPFVAGLIEYNTVIETIGYNIEIKHQSPRPNVAGMPTGDSRTIIRHNVFSKSAATSSTGANARPNLLVGHWPLSGVGQNDRYEIYGNFFFQNPVEVLFQGEGNIFFYDNLMFNSFGTAVAIQRHNDAPRDIHVFNNTIVASNTGIAISGGVAGYVQEAFGNAVFAATPLSGGAIRDNITGTFAQAATYVNNPSANIALLDLYPRTALTGSVINYNSVSNPAGSTLGAATDWDKDFNGTAQPGGVRGSYVGNGTNPGWKPELSRKPTIGSPTPPPTLAFGATPSNVALNGTAQLNWSSNGNACVASEGWSGAKPVQGSEQVGPLITATNFTLTCSNAGGDTRRTVLVSIVAAPSASLSANPTAVTAGATTTLTWNSSNAATCVAGGAWAGNKALSGSEISPALMTSSDFWLTCDGAGGSTRSNTVSVAVSSPPVAPTPPTQPTDSGGGAFSWLFVASLVLLSSTRQHVSVA